MKYRPRTGYLLINKTEEYEQVAATSARKYAKEEFQFKKDKPPACVVDILNGGWKKTVTETRQQYSLHVTSKTLATREKKQ